MEFLVNPTELTISNFFKTSRNERFLFGSQPMVRAFVSLLEDVSSTILKDRGYASEVVLLGVGFRFDPAKSAVSLNLGYSHTICMFLDLNIGYRILKQYLVIFGHRKQNVTGITSIIRGFRTPNVYKAKGIRYLNEFVTLKKGKQKQQK